MKRFKVFLCIVAAVSATNTCSNSTCNISAIHTACGQNEPFNPSCSSDNEIITIDNTLKKVFVDAHNAKRNFIAGGGDARHSPACRMASMKWDDKLAIVAAVNVKRCQVYYDRCRKRDVVKYAGQNLAWMSHHGSIDHGKKLKEAIDMWYYEVRYSQQAYIDSYPKGYSGPAIGHFTVMMIDHNNRVGCAATMYSPPSQSNKIYVVSCNYATTMISFPIYASCNKTGASCITGTNPKYPNLCSDSEEYDVNI